MAKKLLKCPYCESDLELHHNFTGADWDTVKGEGSGYGWVLSLKCLNGDCSRVYPLVHSKEMHSISVVKEEYRNFKNYNL
ncbi:hypothetical protein PASE110613_09200 [Paenibacillus sediminis]|uniref:Uncharacterized protein n=1 Tax=Paenibacillus sediminis TaxID=664909 RepID=A0ABS4H6L9_9BACL|nr:hypothetical protein [Paenibacillus sediminis]MBP1938176.1 hypothetical protein [Paenibacillus sediminis]